MLPSYHVLTNSAVSSESLEVCVTWKSLVLKIALVVPKIPLQTNIEITILVEMNVKLLI